MTSCFPPFVTHRQPQKERPHLSKRGDGWGLKMAGFEEIKTTVHDRWVHVGCEGGPGDFEENEQGIQLVNMWGGLEGEGLEDAIPDVFRIRVSEIDTVRKKVHVGIEAGPGLIRNANKWVWKELQIVGKEITEQ